jgi:hypothetical protein
LINSLPIYYQNDRPAIDAFNQASTRYRILAIARIIEAEVWAEIASRPKPSLGGRAHMQISLDAANAALALMRDGRA